MANNKWKLKAGYQTGIWETDMPNHGKTQQTMPPHTPLGTEIAEQLVDKTSSYDHRYSISRCSMVGSQVWWFFFRRLTQAHRPVFGDD